MRGLSPAQLTVGLPDLVGPLERGVVGRVPLGDEHLAAALHHQLPSLIPLGKDTGRGTARWIAQSPDGNR